PQGAGAGDEASEVTDPAGELRGRPRRDGRRGSPPPALFRSSGRGGQIASSGRHSPGRRFRNALRSPLELLLAPGSRGTLPAGRSPGTPAGAAAPAARDLLRLASRPFGAESSRSDRSAA